MPAISATVYPSPAYVRVEAAWADQPQAVGAAVYRVDCLTGERVPLRPYVSFNGDYLDLSCGYGIWWDTEAQLDRCVYYCTEALNPDGSVILSPPLPIVLDSFSRVVVDSWGNATETGQPWTNTGGTSATDYDVNGVNGTHTHTVVNSLHTSTVDTGETNQDVYGDMMVGITTAVNGQVNQWLIGRYTDVLNYYTAILTLETAGTMTLVIAKRVAGSLIFLSTIPLGITHGASDWWTVRLQVWGSRIRAKAWLRTSGEPADWAGTVTDTSLTTGTRAGFQSRLEVGNTNTLPFVFFFDNFTVTNPCAVATAMTACTPSLVVPSSGDFRLGDPARPCHDTTLLFNAPIDPDCVPTQGIFFGNMADESAAANTNTFIPVNAKYAIVANRTRQSLSSSLTVASKTFADRDALRLLNDPGSPLLLRGPAQYGINDRYMSVGEVNEVRPLPDHRIQPRVVSMPHLQVARPSGPSTGVCGTRVEDLCDIYTTWDAMVAAGLSWADLLRGAASNETPLPASAERDWAEVLSDFTDWTGVNNNNTDWGDVLDGDA